jgi:Flp pilus assembly protein TadD
MATSATFNLTIKMIENPETVDVATQEVVTQSLHENPYDVNVHMLYGAALQATGDPEKAIEHFTTASNLDPNNPEPLRLRADCEYVRGDKGAAIFDGAHAMGLYLSTSD